MAWFADLRSNILPPATGLEVDEAAPLEVTVRQSPGQWIRAIGLLVDREATLYLEGGTSPALGSWLARQATDPPPRLKVGIGPVRDFYHIPLGPGVLDELATRIERPGALGRRIRLHVHQNGRMALQWRKAFTNDPVLVSRRLPADRVARFIEAVGPGRAVLGRSV